MMLLRHAIGHVLRSRRMLLGRTLRDVARDSQVSLPYLSEIERGRKEPSSEIVEAVCAVLRLDVDELLLEAARVLVGGRPVVLTLAASDGDALPVGPAHGGVLLAA